MAKSYLIAGRREAGACVLSVCDQTYRLLTRAGAQ